MKSKQGSIKTPAVSAQQPQARAGKQKPMTPAKVMAKHRKDMRESMAKWERRGIAYNKNTIKRLCEISGHDEHYVVRDILDAAIPEVLPKYRREEMFNSISPVLDVSFVGRRRESMGFHNGKLVLCDGTTMKPITLVQSVLHFKRLELTHDDTSTGNREAIAKWCSMIAKAL